MKIGVTSDTHSMEIPKQLLEDFKSVDLIIHAGDFCASSDVKMFTQLGNFKAVHGNMDDAPVRAQFPERQIIDCEGVKIGLFHGRGSKNMILETVRHEFNKEKLDIIIFGHSHTPMNQKIDNTLYFNPGSPNDMLTAPHCSYGLIEINQGKISAKIIKVA